MSRNQQVPRRRRAVARIAIGFVLVLAVELLGAVATQPGIEAAGFLRQHLPFAAVITIAAVPLLLMLAARLVGLYHIGRGVHDTFEDTHKHYLIRSARDQAIGDGILGGGLFVIATIVVAATFGSRVWGTGLVVSTGLGLAVGVLTLCRLASRLVPTQGAAPAVAIAAGGVALLGLVIQYGGADPTGSVLQFVGGNAALVLGFALVTEGLTRWVATRPSPVERIVASGIDARRDRPLRFYTLMIGCGLLAIGMAVTVVSHRAAQMQGGRYVIGYGPILVGFVLILRATMSGFKSFVAWRYLLVFDIQVTRRAGVAAVVGAAFILYLALGQFGALGPLALEPSAHLLFGFCCFLVVALVWGFVRHAKWAFIVLVASAVVGLGSLIASDVMRGMVAPPELGEIDMLAQTRMILGFVALGAGILAVLSWFFGTLRAFFTFFTTVPIVGVFLGTGALVCVLAVMSGFESDLRDKILGSNAHIQITREDGEFVEWREAKAKIDKIPGVVASTPFAVSEVVIAAHNNGMNVIIKGIDPATVGGVTDLISDLEDRDAMQRLAPIAEDTHDLTVPQTPTPGDGVIDPMPDDMVKGGAPIDFSAKDDDADDDPDAGAGSGTGTGTGPGTGTGTGSEDAKPSDFGGDATELLGVTDDVVDPAPPDLITSDAAPVDYSAPDSADMPRIDVVDLPLEPSLSKRTASLPGVLVGRELVKQTHLYTGEEVRVVSPLSDPSNPDATGTPIPFNRDYRVAGVFYTGMYEYDLKYVYVTLDSLQDFLDRGDAIDGIEVRVTDPDDTGRFIPTDGGAGLIREALGPGYRIVDWRELNRSLFSALKLEKIAMFLVLGIVILVASFSIVGNLIMVVVEKAREIALLKTLGASNVGVTQLFAIQGLMIGLIGTLLGLAWGLGACWAGKRFGLPLNPDVYYIDRLPIHVDPQSVAAAAAAGVFISIAATLYPALLAARVRPAAGMRH